MEYWWKFPSDVLEVLEIFSIFNLEKVPTNCSPNEFTDTAIQDRTFLWIVLWNVGNDDEKRNELTNKWDSSKFELISVRKKCFQSNEDLPRNKLKPDISATEWFLKKIFGTNNVDEYPTIISTKEIVYLIPVNNTWPKRSTPEDDAFNAY